MTDCHALPRAIIDTREYISDNCTRRRSPREGDDERARTQSLPRRRGETEPTAKPKRARRDATGWLHAATVAQRHLAAFNKRQGVALLWASPSAAVNCLTANTHNYALRATA